MPPNGSQPTSNSAERLTMSTGLDYERDFAVSSAEWSAELSASVAVRSDARTAALSCRRDQRERPLHSSRVLPLPAADIQSQSETGTGKGLPVPVPAGRPESV